MRRLFPILIGSWLLTLAAPQPAHAWWEWLEEFSGAGPWKGFDIDSRLVCFVDTNGDKSARVNASRAVRDATKSTDTARAAPSAMAWQDALTAWRSAFEEAERAAGGQAYKAIEAKRDAEDAARAAGTDPMGLRSAAEAYERAAKAMQSVATGGDVRAFAIPGLLYSACALKPYERRRASIDVGMRFLWAKDDQRFAGGERISLTMLQPAFSWNVIDSRQWDFLDYGLGAGFYWISSEAFPSFSGGFLEPIRLDFHAPTNAPTWAKIPIFRAGLLVFPGGFDTNAFAPRADVAHRIGRDWVKSFGIYADVEQILNLLNKP